MPIINQDPAPLPYPSEQIYRQAFMAMNQGFSLLQILFDQAGQAYDVIVRDANPAQDRIDGVQALIGHRVREFLPDIEHKWIERYAQIVRSQQTAHFEDWSQANQRWYEVDASPVGGPGSSLVAILYTDITQRKQFEHYQAYLLALSDALRPIADPARIEQTVTQLALEQFGADRCYYCRLEAGMAIITRDAMREGLPSVAGAYPLSSFALLKKAVDAGQPFVVEDAATTPILDETIRAICLQMQVISFVNVPVIKQGQVVGVLCTVQATPRRWSELEIQLAAETAERTWAAVERANADETLRASEQRFRRLADTLPQAIWITDPQGNAEFLNQWWADYSGIPFATTTAWQIAADMLHPADGPLVAAAFRQAIEQGTGFAIEQRNRSASGEYRWFFNIGVPYRDADDGPITHWIGSSVDIHELKQASQALLESRDWLQSVIDMAQLGSYSIDLVTDRLTKSPRVAGWYGLPEVTDVATSLNAILEADRAHVGQVYAAALQPGSSGAYQAEYTVINQQTGYRRRLRMIGQVIYDDAGQAVRVEGTVMDVTTQQAVQQALEQQVRQRTEELAEANEKLVASNDELAQNNQEYAAINEELQEANYLLKRSNENLQQFAYVASHDLQEPLRKIQQFGDLLKARYADPTGLELDYVDRMQSAAKRMSILIKDLLNYSRISTQQDVRSLVSLQTVVDSVLNTLELPIKELGAQIQIGPLPSVMGDGSQLGQLFQNLLSNALKFHRMDPAGVPVTPVIRLEARLLEAGQLPSGIKPSRPAKAYHQIVVIDNGIGFDEKYLDRIFQVFQRLHGKGEFAGTGIGLAICEKVVTNHGGVITASSQAGKGASFTIYLPE